MNMTNILIILLTFLLLVTQKILLLNEESLILLCFITFIVLSLNNFQLSLNSLLVEQSLQIEKTLKNSLGELLITLNKFLTLKKIFNNTFKSTILLKNYYIKFVNLLTNFIPSYNTYYLNLLYKKRLNFLTKVENQTIKLLTIIIVKKLNKILKTKQFFSSSIKFYQFLCLNSISIRECIKLVNLTKK